MKLVLIFCCAATVVLALEEFLPKKRRVVCYYTNWSVYRQEKFKFSSKNIEPDLCTHILYAFVAIDEDGNDLKPFDAYQDIEKHGFESITDLKKKNTELKVMVSVGGWNEGSSRFSSITEVEERRQKFADNVVKFLREHSFDGIDICWQYPSFREGSKPQDKENYASLIQEVREKFEMESSQTGKPRLLLSSVFSGLSDYIEKGFDVQRIDRYVDFINVVAYDYHLPSGPVVRHHSPLYTQSDELGDPIYEQLNVDSSIRNLVAKGVKREKLNLGIPTYGRLYTLEEVDETDPGSPAFGSALGNTTAEPGYVPYYEVCSDIQGGGWTVKQNSENASGPYAFKNELWVGFDDEESVKRKAEYAVMNGLGGIMFWTFDDDDFLGRCHNKTFPLIKAGLEGLRVLPPPLKIKPIAHVK